MDVWKNRQLLRFPARSARKSLLLIPILLPSGDFDNRLRLLSLYDKMPVGMGLKLNPLTPAQRERFRTAAKDGDPYERLAGLVLLDTGLRRDTFAHLRDISDNKWYQPAKSPPEILVPPEDECKVGYGRRGDQSTKGEDVCAACTDRGAGCWLPKTDNTPRRVWIHEPDTQSAIEDWFTLHDEVSAPQKVNRAVNTIADRADLGRNVSPHHLRQTYGSKLAEEEHQAHHIRDLMGHSSIKTSERYVRLYGPKLKEIHTEKWQ